MLFFAAVLISVISLVDVVRSTNLVTANPAEVLYRRVMAIRAF